MDKKQKNAKVNRILYVSMVVVLCALAVVVAITSGVMRARRDAALTTAPDETSAPPSETKTSGTTAAPTGTKAPDTTADKPTGLNPEKNSSPETTGKDVVTPGDGNYNETEPPKPTLPTFTVPVRGSVSKGHDKDTAVYSLTMDDWRVHLGVDIACGEGDTVTAAADGTVSQVWKDPLMGACVSIAHDGAGVSIYKNLDPDIPESISVGKTVKAGEAIGKVGESALIEIAEEPHLHFELTVNGIHVDPMDYFSKESVSTSLTVLTDE